MKTNLFLLLVSAVLCGVLVVACGVEESPDDNDGSDNNNGSDLGSDNHDTNNPAVCALDALETFDTAVPTGWTVISSGGGGSGSGSGSGSGTGTGSGNPGVVDPAKTWHHTTVDTETGPAAKFMNGGYMTVGGIIGMNEALITPIYYVGACNAVNLTFTHYFDDFGAATGKTADRGEVSIAVDGPPYMVIGTYNSNPNKSFENASIDLTNYVVGAEYFQLEFVFADDNQGNYGWSIDDVKVTGAP